MKRLVVEYWMPLWVWLLMMVFFSTDVMSSNETSRFIGPFLTLLFPGFSTAQIDFWHGVIRKCAHITEYFILAMFLYRGLKFESSDLVDAKLRAMVFVVLVAVADEVHQGFTNSRTGSVIDVGYDGLGGLWALWLVGVYESWNLRPHSVL